MNSTSDNNNLVSVKIQRQNNNVYFISALVHDTYKVYQTFCQFDDSDIVDHTVYMTQQIKSGKWVVQVTMHSQCITIKTDDTFIYPTIDLKLVVIYPTVLNFNTSIENSNLFEFIHLLYYGCSWTYHSIDLLFQYGSIEMYQIWKQRGLDIPLDYWKSISALDVKDKYLYHNQRLAIFDSPCHLYDDNNWLHQIIQEFGPDVLYGFLTTRIIVYGHEMIDYGVFDKCLHKKPNIHIGNPHYQPIQPGLVVSFQQFIILSANVQRASNICDNLEIIIDMIHSDKDHKDHKDHKDQMDQLYNSLETFHVRFLLSNDMCERYLVSWDINQQSCNYTCIGDGMYYCRYIYCKKNSGLLINANSC